MDVHLIARRAVINRYGFNNDGLDAVAQRLATFRQRSAAEPWRCPGLVAVNLGAVACARMDCTAPSS